MTYIRLCVDVDFDRIFGTVSCWLWTNRTYVGIGACLNLNVALLGTRCNMKASQMYTHILFKHTAMTICTAIRNCIVLPLNEQGVRCKGSCVNLIVPLLGLRCTMTLSQLLTRLRLKYITLVLMTYGSALLLPDYMERYHVGFGRAACTSISTCLNVPSTGMRHAMHYDTITIAYSPTIQLLLQCHMTRVGFGWTDRMFVLVHVWIWVP